MQGTVLVVEDDEGIAELMREHLSAAGFPTALARSGQEAVAVLESSDFALVVLDIGAPALDEFGIARSSRWHPQVPVLVVSALSADVDEARVLALGADDFLTKPFTPIELIARVRALLRRVASPPTLAPIAVGDIAIDPTRREVRRGGHIVPTTGLEFELLHLFASQPGRVFTRDHLLRQVWGPGRIVERRAVDNLVSRLRQKLEADPQTPRLFVTLWGLGYRFDPEPSP